MNYNIAIIEHQIIVDDSCGCKVKADKAEIKILHKHLSPEELDTLREEIRLANTYQYGKDVDKYTSQSKFRSLPYNELASLYKYMILDHLVILPIFQL